MKSATRTFTGFVPKELSASKIIDYDGDDHVRTAYPFTQVKKAAEKYSRIKKARKVRITITVEDIK